MYYVRKQQKDQWHTDKFYTANTKAWGHFIMVRGYKKVDDKYFYEVYDPNSYGKSYPGGYLKGIDRFYRSQDLDSAVSNWWNYAIIVSRTTIKDTEEGVDINKIIHKPGF